MLRIECAAPTPGILPCDAHPVAHFAKVVSPLHSVEARGRMGGLVYGTWHGISYVKAYSGPNQPNSAAQLAARARMTTIGAEWRELTDANRAAWAVYAAEHLESDWTGQNKRLTAQNWYIRCNTMRHRLGSASVATPPATAAPDAVTVFAVVDNAGDVDASWTSPNAGTYYLDFWTLGPVSTGVDPKFEHAVVRALIVDNTAQDYALVAAAAAGRWRAWVRSVNIDNGLSSNFVSSQVDI